MRRGTVAASDVVRRLWLASGSVGSMVGYPPGRDGCTIRRRSGQGLMLGMLALERLGTLV